MGRWGKVHQKKGVCDFQTYVFELILFTRCQDQKIVKLNLENSKVWQHADTKNKPQAKTKNTQKFPPDAKRKNNKPRNKNIESHFPTPAKKPWMKTTLFSPPGCISDEL